MGGEAGWGAERRKRRFRNRRKKSDAPAVKRGKRPPERRKHPVSGPGSLVSHRPRRAANGTQRNRLPDGEAVVTRRPTRRDPFATNRTLKS